MSGEGTEGGTAERSDGFPSLHRARSGSFIDPDISLSVGVKCHIRRKMPTFLQSPSKCWTLSSSFTSFPLRPFVSRSLQFQK